MLDMLMILPYNHAGQSIDWGTDFVLTCVEREELPSRAKSRMAQGVAQAEEALRADRYRVIVLVEYDRWGPGTAKVWELIQNAVAFDKTRLRFAIGGPSSGYGKSTW